MTYVWFVTNLINFIASSSILCFLLNLPLMGLGPVAGRRRSSEGVSTTWGKIWRLPEGFRRLWGEFWRPRDGFWRAWDGFWRPRGGFWRLWDGFWRP